MTISLVHIVHAKVAEAGKCHVPFLMRCWEPGAYGWEKRRGSMYCREGTHSTFQQNPAHMYSHHTSGKLYTKSQKHEDRDFCTSAFSDITKWIFLPEGRESSWVLFLCSENGDYSDLIQMLWEGMY